MSNSPQHLWPEMKWNPIQNVSCSVLPGIHSKAHCTGPLLAKYLWKMDVYFTFVESVGWLIIQFYVALGF